MKSEDFSKNLKKIMDELLRQAEESLNDLGNEAAQLIKKRTRLGYGVSEVGGTKEKLEPLSEPYKKQRKGKISGPTTPAKSNLTYSGELLDDLQAFHKDGKVTIGFEEGSLSFKKAEWVSKLRPFNHLSKAETQQLKKKLEQDLFTKLQKIKTDI